MESFEWNHEWHGLQNHEWNASHEKVCKISQKAKNVLNSLEQIEVHIKVDTYERVDVYVGNYSTDICFGIVFTLKFRRNWIKYRYKTICGAITWANISDVDMHFNENVRF